MGAINDFVRESIKDYYKNIYMTEVKVMLVHTGVLLEQIDEELGKFALEVSRYRYEKSAVETGGI